jgi:predicted NAD-dependent protein-ADP-ribosyltransferase YbiA (DUF1768 family)
VLHDELAFEVRWAVAGESVVIQLVAKLGESYEMNEFYSLFFCEEIASQTGFEQHKGINLKISGERWKRVEMHLKAMRFFLLFFSWTKR